MRTMVLASERSLQTISLLTAWTWGGPLPPSHPCFTPRITKITPMHFNWEWMVCSYNDKNYQKWNSERTHIMKTCPEKLSQQIMSFKVIMINFLKNESVTYIQRNGQITSLQLNFHKVNTPMEPAARWNRTESFPQVIPASHPHNPLLPTQHNQPCTHSTRATLILKHYTCVF